MSVKPKILRDRGSRCLCLDVEALESRQMLAGNVSVSVVAGSLTVTGDDSANAIRIHAIGADPGDVIVESGQNATTINGQAGPLTFSGTTKDVRVLLGGGSDELQVSLVTLPRDLIVSGGDGSNLVSIGRTVVERHVRLDHRAGFDQFSMFLSSIKGNTLIDNGDGGSRFNAGSFGSFVGRVSVTTDSGFSEIDARRVSFGSSLNIRTGSNGFSTSSFDLVSVSGNVTARHDGVLERWDIVESTFTGDMRLMLGDGGSDVDVSLSQFDGKLVINSGDGYSKFRDYANDFEGRVSITNRSGDSRTSFGESRLNDDLVISNGDGFDEVSVDLTSIDGDVRVTNRDGASETSMEVASTGGDFVLTSADGDDYLNTNYMTIQGSARITTGDDGDILRLGDTDVHDRLSITGNGSMLIDLDDVEVTGSATIRSGQQVDVVRIDDSEFLGPFRLMTRGGSDIVQVDVQQTNLVEATIFRGTTRIHTGSGNDSVRLGISAEPWRTCTFWAKPRLDGGSGADTLLDEGNVFLAGPPSVRSFETVL